VPKKHTNSFLFQKKYLDIQLKKHILQHVDNTSFNRHCQEVAANLKIDVLVVKELLLDNSFTVLSLIQQNALKNKEVKINITGYFSFITTLIKYKYTHLRKFTGGKTY
jgi:hypothetical protein